MIDFNENYFTKRKHIAWRAPHVCKAISNAIEFHSVIDIGCGIGEFVAEWRRQGKDATGLDNALVLPEMGEIAGYFFRADITKPVYMDQRFDLALCIEVASILDPCFHEQLSANLIRISDQILMTQPGYCDYILNVHGYRRIIEVENEIKEVLAPWGTKPAIKALYHGITFYRHDRLSISPLRPPGARNFSKPPLEVSTKDASIESRKNICEPLSMSILLDMKWNRSKSQIL